MNVKVYYDLTLSKHLGNTIKLLLRRLTRSRKWGIP